jgi:DNA-binding transcriptional regulator YdaS (Cro superfamily)
MVDVGHGVVQGLAGDLTEYTSRAARLRLVEAAAQGVAEDLREKRDRGVSNLDSRAGASLVLAGLLGVSQRTVNRWLRGGVQSCNVNCARLIEVALQYSPQEAWKILGEDAEAHVRVCEALRHRVGHGGVQL